MPGKNIEALYEGVLTLSSVERTCMRFVLRVYLAECLLALLSTVLTLLHVALLWRLMARPAHQIALRVSNAEAASE